MEHVPAPRLSFHIGVTPYGLSSGIICSVKAQWYMNLKGQVRFYARTIAARNTLIRRDTGAAPPPLSGSTPAQNGAETML